jgi:hypothetical protein
MEKDLSKQIAATYKVLRLGLAVLAFAFPPILAGGGFLLAGLPLAGSLSAYYHYHPIESPRLDKGGIDQSVPAQGVASKDIPGQGVMRNVFVGILFAVGGLLFAYQGFSRLEDYVLNLAGILAWGVALFPMSWAEGTKDSSFSLHGTFAIAFFISIAYVCIFRSGDTLPLIEDDAIRNRYLKTYRLLGGAMVGLPLVAWAFLSLSPWRTSVIFFVELAGIYVFATYWVVKSHEASKTRMDEKATRGELRVPPHGVSDVLRQLPVTPVDNPAQQQE